MTNPVMTLKLTGSMEAVLDQFAAEPCPRATKGYLADETGYSPETVRNRLNELRAAGSVKLVHEGTSLWHLESDPRDDE